MSYYLKILDRFEKLRKSGSRGGARVSGEGEEDLEDSDGDGDGDP